MSLEEKVKGKLAKKEDAQDGISNYNSLMRHADYMGERFPAGELHCKKPRYR